MMNETNSERPGIFRRIFGGLHPATQPAEPCSPGPQSPARPELSRHPDRRRPSNLTTLNFNRFLQENPRVVVDFWASWCRPCKVISPMLEAAAKDMPGGLEVGKVNIDHEPSLARKWEVKSIPTLIVFCHQKPVGRIVGVSAPAVLRNKLEHSLRHCES